MILLVTFYKLWHKTPPTRDETIRQSVLLLIGACLIGFSAIQTRPSATSTLSTSREEIPEAAAFQRFWQSFVQE